MIEFVKYLKKTIQIGIFGLAVISLVACTTRYRNHGYIPSQEELADIVVGIDTRDSVIETVGPPSSSGVLNDSGLYYVSSRIRFYGARKPKVIERQLVAISFDSRGIVKNIERFGLENGQVIPLERRVTSSGISGKTFIRQLLGNIGGVTPQI